MASVVFWFKKHEQVSIYNYNKIYECDILCCVFRFEHVATIFRQALNQVDELVRNLTLVRFENDRHLMLAEQYSNQMDEWLLKHLNKFVHSLFVN